MRLSTQGSGLPMCMSQTPIGSIRAAANTIISFLPKALLMPDTTNGSLWNATLGILIRKCLNRFSFCTKYSALGSEIQV